MFKFLKEKLKNWVSKIKPEEELKIVKVKPKKANSVKEKKGKSAEKVKIPEKKQTKEPKKAKPKEIKEDTLMQATQDKNKGDVAWTEKKSFFSFLKRKDQADIGESLDKETDKKLAKELYEHQEKEKKESVEEKEEKKSFFDRFRTKLDDEKFEELFSELEMILLQNNVALEVVDQIKKFLKEELVGKNLKDVNVEDKLKQAIENVLLEPADFISEIKKSITQKQPYVIAFVGINGSGKTTTIAKVAHLLIKKKFSVCLAAADTFRAAAIQQLEEHAKRLGVPIIKKDYGTDPASVGFDAIMYAKKHHIDVVLIDTAGRMNTKDSLMKEMEKIIRVTKPDMKIFIGESITGNDAVQQARDFNDSIDLTGIILSKADVDEKAGAILSVSYVTKKPILFLGVGQNYDDMDVFDKKRVIENLGL
jgi:fused signal recognition particle receptor